MSSRSHPPEAVRYRGSGPRYRVRDRLGAATENSVELAGDGRKGGEEAEREGERRERNGLSRTRRIMVTRTIVAGTVDSEDR